MPSTTLTVASPLSSPHVGSTLAIVQLGFVLDAIVIVQSVVHPIASVTTTV